VEFEFIPSEEKQTEILTFEAHLDYEEMVKQYTELQLSQQEYDMDNERQQDTEILNNLGLDILHQAQGF
jgi:hypothetical protein